MAKNLDKITARVASDLAPGETLLAAVKVTPRGNMEQGILGVAGAVAGGGLGMLAGDKLGKSSRDAGEAERSAAGFDLGNNTQVLAGVTEKRLLMWKISSLGGKPKEMVAEMPLTDIASMVMGEGKLMGQTMPEIIVTTAGGAEFGLRVAKVHKKDAEQLLSATGN